jgi:hypothetical protein
LNDVAQVAARGTNDLTAIGSTVLQIEGALQGVPGPQKLQAVATLITPIIESAEFLLGTDPGDDAEFNAGVKDMANAVVRIYNSRKPKVNLKNTGTVSVLSAPLATPTPVAPDPAKP